VETTHILEDSTRHALSKTWSQISSREESPHWQPAGVTQQATVLYLLISVSTRAAEAPSFKDTESTICARETIRRSAQSKKQMRDWQSLSVRTLMKREEKVCSECPNPRWRLRKASLATYTIQPMLSKVELRPHRIANLSVGRSHSSLLTVLSGSRLIA
jgi:hypothetical protein